MPPEDIAVHLPANESQEPAYAPSVLSEAQRSYGTGHSVVPSPQPDSADGDAAIVATQYVFQAELMPPGASTVAKRKAPRAELSVLIGRGRLRADFRGEHWTGFDGLQVRLRADRSGGYFFHGSKARPFEISELASSIEGCVPQRAAIYVLGHRKSPPEHADLFCRLLDGVAGVSAGSSAQKCSNGVPRLFRLGVWRVELLAASPVTVQHDELRADQLAPPRNTMPPTTEWQLLQSDVTMLKRYGQRASKGVITLQNNSRCRMLFLLGGAYVGHAAPGATLDSATLDNGYYPLLAYRPLGLTAIAPRRVSVPSRVRLPR